jgi:glycerate kinase
LDCDVCPVDEDLSIRTHRPSEVLDELDLDRRMRAARAVVIACAHLEDRTLAGSVAFEAATRARQSGVPAYAVTGRNALNPFEARIVDLQVVLEASTTRALSAAGHKLAALV